MSITVGGAWKNTLPKPPVNQWFHVVGTWEQSGAACAYLNGRKGLCEANPATNNGPSGLVTRLRTWLHAQRGGAPCILVDI